MGDIKMENCSIEPHLIKGVEDFFGGNIKAKELQSMLDSLGRITIDEQRLPLKGSLIETYKQALDSGAQPRIHLIGLFTFFRLCPVEQTQDNFRKLKSVYLDMIDEIVQELGKGIAITFDEPVLAEDSPLHSLRCIYKRSAVECIYQVIPEKGVHAIVTPEIKAQQ